MEKIYVFGIPGLAFLILAFLACGQQVLPLVSDDAYLPPSANITYSNEEELGDIIMEYRIRFSGHKGFGTEMMTVVTDLESLPPEGALFEMTFQGNVRGPRIIGTIEGVEYAHALSDGNVQLHIHAAITTDDGYSIAMVANGISTPEQGTKRAKVFHEGKLFASSPRYSWVNDMRLSTEGIVDPVIGEVQVRAFRK